MRTSRRFSVLATLTLFSGWWLWPASQAQSPAKLLPSTTAAQSQRENLVGTSSCSARACHGGLSPVAGQAVQQNEHTTWLTLDKHAQAYLVLFEKRSQEIAKYIPNAKGEKVPAHKNDRCLACHTNTLSLANAEASPILAEELIAGVGCEACHGGAREWLGPHTKPGWKRALGMTATWNIVGYAEKCVGCHVGAGETKDLPLRDVNHDLIAAGHPRLNFEFSVFLDNVPRHWSLKKEQEKPPDFAAKAWTLGQLVSAEAALELLHYRASSRQAPWPEFAEYDCFACHHDLGQPSWRQKSEHYDGRQPGSLPWGSWYFSMTTSVLASQDAQPKSLLGLKNLTRMMQKPQPIREEIAQQAAAVASVMKAWLEGVDANFDSRAVSKQVISSSDRCLKLASQNWDGAEQVYLALAALAAQNEGLKPALETLGRDLAFGPVSGRHRYDSPEQFVPDKDEFASRLAALLRQLGK
jgi:hypothetical protein